jgi:glycosyltransferase involved in cell wall biosynthesis
MKNQSAKSISVITATFNAIDNLQSLLTSLRAQTDKNFEWVVADGASTDGTLDLLNTVTDLDLVITSHRDFGIYDGINRGIQHSSGDYYIVAGADDNFAPNAIEKFRAAIMRSGADIIVATAKHPFGRAYIKKGPSWMVGEKAFIANHSLATAFRSSLHDDYGWYSSRFPLAADSLFILQSCKGGASRYVAGFEAGLVGGDGISYTDWVGSATELFRVQIMVGCSILPQTILLILRIIKGSNLRLRSLFNSISQIACRRR